VGHKYFLMTVFGITVVVLLILNSFLTGVDQFVVVLSACGLALINVLCGYYMTRWAFRKSMKTFFNVVMGGMGIRLVIIGAVMVVLIRVLTMDVKLFIVTFGIYYLLFQLVEIYFINRGLQLKKVIK
jgi:hypothetical protein